VVTFPRRDEIWLVELDPVRGAAIQKTRPALIVSPDESNEFLRTVIVAPMTPTERPYPTRGVDLPTEEGQVALDQLRAVYRHRLIRKLGSAPAPSARAVSCVLVEMFTRG
jgi:mRNA interferase MazF